MPAPQAALPDLQSKVSEDLALEILNPFAPIRCGSTIEKTAECQGKFAHGSHECNLTALVIHKR
jgi:hypothetical protein